MMKDENQNANMIEVDEALLKPVLANSAVLRALEEEENEQYGGYKRVAWPPTTEARTIREFTPQPSPQPPYQQPQPNYQQPGGSPVPAANQGGHYIQSQPNYQSSYPNQQQHQQPQQQQHNQPEPYYLQQRPPQPSAAAGKPSTVSFSGGIAQPVYNTPKPSPQPQYQYPAQSQPPQEQQHQQLYQQPPFSPEPPQQQQQHHQYQQQPQPNYPVQEDDSQLLNEPSQSHRWGHVASPVPQRSGYVQPGSPSVQPPFNSAPQFGSPQQQNHYGATSVPQVNHCYDRQPSYGTSQQHQPVAPAPIAPATAAPQQYYQAHQQPQQQQYNQSSQPNDNQYNYYSQPEPQHQQQQQQYQPLQQQQYRGESPGIITLRKEAPVTQKPAPVYSSQPAAASYQGGSNMRGDLKWPPPEYKEQAVVENEERRRIAQGPICRPRRINKDYTQFFAKNALSHHYPSYKVPPGTQHIYGSY